MQQILAQSTKHALMPIKVAIVEDDAQIREGLAFLISNSGGLKCVGTYPNAETALEHIPAQHPDVVLMDVQLPGMSGIECISRLKSKMPGLQIMMLTVFDDPDRIFRSLKAGASGYLVKKTPPAQLVEAIRDLHRGGSPMSGQIARRVVELFQQPLPGTEKLTGREREILDFLTRGFLYKEIALETGISVETVRTHIRNIYQKLHVRTRTEAILKTLPPGPRRAPVSH